MTEKMRSRLAIGLAVLALLVTVGGLVYQQGATGEVVTQGTRWWGAGGFALPAAGKVTVDGSTIAQTQTGGAVDINMASITANTSGLNVASTQNNGAATGTDQYGAVFTLTQDDADGDMRGVSITAANTGVEAAGSYEYGLSYACAVTVAGGCTDGAIFTSAGVASGLTDAVDASAANIDNALNAGANDILFGDDTLDGAVDDTLRYTRNDSGSVTYTCADDDANAECIYDSGGSGNVQVGSADTAVITLQTDDTGDGTDLVLPAQGVNAVEVKNDDLTFAQISDSSAVDADTKFTLADGIELELEASHTTGDTAVLLLDVDQTTDITATDDMIAFHIAATSESAETGDTIKGIVIDYEEGDANTIMDAAIEIDNDETTASTMTDAVIVKSTGVAAGVTDAFDASDSNIVNAINIGVNPILGSNADTLFLGLTDHHLTLTGNEAAAVTFIGADDAGAADTIFDTTGAGTITVGSADVTNVTINSDVGLTFAGNSESLNNLADGTFDFTRNDAGTITLTASDNNAVADLVVDPGGAAALKLGSADVVSVAIQADADIQLWNGATGNVDLSFHDYADSADDDMAHVLLRANCTDATTASEDCDFTIGVAEGGSAADTRFMIDADGGVDIGSANSSDVTLTAGTAVAIFNEPAAAGSGGDIWDITATFLAMDGSDTSLGMDINLTGANATGTTNLLYGIDLDLTTADAQVTEKAIDLNDSDWDYAIDAGAVPIVSTAATFMDDFFGGTIQTWWTELSGSNGSAVQAIQANAQYGEYQITSGADGANCAADCEGIVLGTHWSADQGSLIFETRLHIDTAVANDIVFAGFSDNAGLEMPVTMVTDTITAVADDFCGFIYDTTSTTDEWFAACFDATVEGTGSGATGIIPVANTYQVLRIEIDAGGEDARFYINGALVRTITANAITITDLLTPMIIVDTNAAESNVVDVDYVFVSAQRQ